MDGWMDGCMDGWKDERIDWKWVNERLKKMNE